MSQQSRFGILAHSSEGAALCFLTFCREGFAEMGQHMHPDVMMDCAAMGHVMPAWAASSPCERPAWRRAERRRTSRGLV